MVKAIPTPTAAATSNPTEYGIEEYMAATNAAKYGRECWLGRRWEIGEAGRGCWLGAALQQEQEKQKQTRNGRLKETNNGSCQYRENGQPQPDAPSLAWTTSHHTYPINSTQHNLTQINSIPNEIQPAERKANVMQLTLHTVMAAQISVVDWVDDINNHHHNNNNHHNTNQHVIQPKKPEKRT